MKKEEGMVRPVSYTHLLRQSVEILHGHVKIVFQTGTDSAVNANQLSIQVEKRAAGIPPNQLAVRLNDAVLEGNHPAQALSLIHI